MEISRREQGNLVIEDIPEIPQRIVERMLRYRNTRSAGINDWDPAGEGMLISTRFAETTQIHYVENPGGARRQITFFSEPVGGGSMCPDPHTRGFLFAKDVGGGEFYQIFYFDLDSGEYTMLTDGASRNGAAKWSNKGDRFTYYSTKRNGRDWDLFLSDLENPQQAKPILQEDGAWVPVDWSPDDNRLLVMKQVSINESYYYVLDIESGELTQINPTEKKIGYGSAVWAKDGKGIFITSDETGEFKSLKYYDLDKKTFTDLTAEIAWDIREIETSHQGDTLAFTANEDGSSRLYLLDTNAMEYKQVSGIPAGQISGLKFHPDDDRLAMTINTPRTPGDIYVLHLKDNSLVRWTYSEVGGLNTDSFVAPELIHYETFDKRMIPAFYYKPSKGDAPCPVLIAIHGGPEGQYVPGFSADAQYYANELGIAFIAPNVRGSAGYGKSNLLLDNGYKREDTVKDIGKLLDNAEKTVDEMLAQHHRVLKTADLKSK